MEFNTLEPTKLIALMIAGGLFALAGLWLMFRPRKDGHSAKIELFGMKFESSSAGLLVFVIGAAFLASPLFVQERDVAASPQASATADAMRAPTSGIAEADSSASTEDAARPAQETASTAGSVPVQTRVPRYFKAVGAEIEPNDNIAEANQIEVGSVISGDVRDVDVDWYSFVFPKSFSGNFSVNLAGRGAGFRIYDDIGARYSQGLSTAFTGKVEQERYYVEVFTSARRVNYSLTVAARLE